MVKLTGPFDQAGRAVGERGSERGASRSHYNWGARYGRRKPIYKTEPTGLLELEELTLRTVQLMEKHSLKSEGNYPRAMDLLRLQYNMVWHLIYLSSETNFLFNYCCMRGI